MRLIEALGLQSHQRREHGVIGDAVVRFIGQLACGIACGCADWRGSSDIVVSFDLEEINKRVISRLLKTLQFIHYVTCGFYG